MAVQSIVKTKRGKDLTVKLVCSGIPEAEEMEDLLNEQIESSNHLIEKMQALYGLKSVSVSLVHHQVFILYKFLKDKDARDFEISFVKYIKDDGSNIVDAFLITEAKEEVESKDEFIVSLALPDTAVKALEMFPSLAAVQMEGYSKSLIYRDSAEMNGKKVTMLTRDLSLELLEVSYVHRKIKYTRQIPQKWLEVAEIEYKAIVNVQWATLPKNIVKTDTKGFYSKVGDKEIHIPLYILSMDGTTVTLVKHEGEYVNITNREQRFAPEMVIFK